MYYILSNAWTPGPWNKTFNRQQVATEESGNKTSNRFRHMAALQKASGGQLVLANC